MPAFHDSVQDLSKVPAGMLFLVIGDKSAAPVVGRREKTHPDERPGGGLAKLRDQVVWIEEHVGDSLDQRGGSNRLDRDGINR